MATNLRAFEFSNDTQIGLPDDWAVEIDTLDRVISFLSEALQASKAQTPGDVAEFYKSEAPLVIEDGRDALVRLALAARRLVGQTGA